MTTYGSKRTSQRICNYLSSQIEKDFWIISSEISRVRLRGLVKVRVPRRSFRLEGYLSCLVIILNLSHRGDSMFVKGLFRILFIYALFFFPYANFGYEYTTTRTGSGRSNCTS